jgi:hypothetical protein
MNPDILAILESIQIFMDYLAQEGGNLSREAQDQLMSFINESIAFVEAQQAQPPQPEEQPPAPEPGIEPPTTPSIPTGGPVPPLEDAPNPSSNISRFRYDPQTQNLFIQFLGKYPNRNGPVYSYQGVPPNIFKLLQRGAVGPVTSGANRWHRWNRMTLPSHGAAAYHLIRTSFPYQRIR